MNDYDDFPKKYPEAFSVMVIGAIIVVLVLTGNLLRAF